MAERNHLIATSPAQAAQAPERSAEEIRQDIAARREQITETVDRLSDRFHQTFDWRTYVAEYPLVALGVAAGAGLLVSGLFKRRQTPGERMLEAFSESVEDLADRFRHQLDGAGLARSRSSGLSRTVRAAATGAVTKAVTDYLRNRLAESGIMRPTADDVAASAGYHAQEQRRH
ncbi:MAG TPA: DUF3618 domain-containing protein [Blastocatellia bacterium]|nr:DUF3618 domain-containing protein [Blastocatellia bacterium]